MAHVLAKRIVPKVGNMYNGLPRGALLFEWRCFVDVDDAIDWGGSSEGFVCMPRSEHIAQELITNPTQACRFEFLPCETYHFQRMIKECI